jgi:hypothetical protein
MGIRPNEPDWKHEVNDLIRELQPQIQAILQDYGVPLLDEQGRLIGAEQPPAATGVPEPEGYRMEKYRAPVPATLAGATVLTTAALRQLIAERHPILIDVLPKTRKPKDRAAEQVWVEPPRENIPGSVWLPNTGYGELSSGYAQVWCTGSGGGLFLDGLRGLAVAEAHALDQLGEPLRTIQPAPVPLGRLGELENHRQRGLA